MALMARVYTRTIFQSVGARASRKTAKPATPNFMAKRCQLDKAAYGTMTMLRR